MQLCDISHVSSARYHKITYSLFDSIKRFPEKQANAADSMVNGQNVTSPGEYSHIAHSMPHKVHIPRNKTSDRARVIAKRDEEDADARASSSLHKQSPFGRYRASLIDCPSRLPWWYPEKLVVVNMCLVTAPPRVHIIERFLKSLNPRVRAKLHRHCRKMVNKDTTLANLSPGLILRCCAIQFSPRLT